MSEGILSPEELDVLLHGDRPFASSRRDLGFVEDVPLQITVELGQKKMRIKDVLNIGTGTVVRLDTLADEPVRLLVNGGLVAEGEVVVVGDHFGVKITRVVGISDDERYLCPSDTQS